MLGHEDKFCFPVLLEFLRCLHIMYLSLVDQSKKQERNPTVSQPIFCPFYILDQYSLCCTWQTFASIRTG